MRERAVALSVLAFAAGCPRGDACRNPGANPEAVVVRAYDAARQADVEGVLRCLTGSGRSRLVGENRAALFRSARLLQSTRVVSAERGAGTAAVSVALQLSSGLERTVSVRLLDESSGGIGASWRIDALAVP